MDLRILRRRILTPCGLVPSWVIWVDGRGKGEYHEPELVASFLKGVGLPQDEIRRITEPFRSFLDWHFPLPAADAQASTINANSDKAEGQKTLFPVPVKSHSVSRLTSHNRQKRDSIPLGSSH